MRPCSSFTSRLYTFRAPRPCRLVGKSKCTDYYGRAGRDASAKRKAVSKTLTTCMWTGSLFLRMDLIDAPHAVLAVDLSQVAGSVKTANFCRPSWSECGVWSLSMHKARRRGYPSYPPFIERQVPVVRGLTRQMREKGWVLQLQMQVARDLIHPSLVEALLEQA
jgi:hypothetical protein